MITEQQNNVKHFLKKGYRINERIKEKIAEINDIRDIATSIPGIDYSRDRVQVSRSSGDAKFVDMISKICELEDSIQKSLIDLMQIKIDIRFAINQLSDTREISVLTLRYIKFYTWEQICNEVQLSLRTVHRVHADALNNMVNLKMFKKDGDAA